ncbi:MAG: DNRLRE domain-containing protein [Sedimentisphaerales bacterium]|nr:DNRLRE domain-containing protein [Sedimentisphaerales bacterium]
MVKQLISVVCMGLALAVAAGAQAATMTVGSAADTWVAPNETGTFGAEEYMALQGASVRRTGYLRFDLSALNIIKVESATLTLNVHGAIPKPPYRNDTVVIGRFSLYGLNDVSGNTPQNWDEAALNVAGTGSEVDWTAGTVAVVGGRAVDLDGEVAGITETITNAAAGGYALGTTITVTGDALVGFLQSRVDDGGLVTFLLKNDDATDRGYGICSKEYADEAYRPKLDLTVVIGPKTAASNPSPQDDATDVVRDVVLSWRAGIDAIAHNVYLGTSLADVDSASASVLVSPEQDSDAYDPPGHLAFGQTYYWRVDEVGAPDGTVHPGPIWSFTVEPYSYPITGVTATASSSDVGVGPENTVNGSGLDANDLHSSYDKTMWISGKKATQPTWIEYRFDRTYKLHEMWVWNHNMTTESVVGVGFKDVTIECSINGADWTTLGDFEFTQAPSADGYAHNTTVDFAGAAAQYVRLTPKSNWGDMVEQYGLSEVRFFYVPTQAGEPLPATATAGVDPRTLVLSWRAGREAASHNVLISTDQQAVIEGTAPVLTVDQAICVPSALVLGATHYWKVVEVNRVETPAEWRSDVWSFSTLAYLTVDDFEGYTNESPNRVFQTWIDGMGFSPDEFFPNGGDGNGSGALVGYDPTLGDIMETDIVHGGRQAMPLYYDNTSAPGYSETVRTFATPQDWSLYGITTLVLHFRGDVNNVPAPLYVKINGTKVLYNGGTPSTALAIWKQWNIDLSSVGANLKSVKTLAIGIGDGSGGGTGTIFIDDILLYATAPQVVVATDPGTSGLVALYGMEDNLKDSSGKGNDGTASGNPLFVQGLTGHGKALSFDGTNDYVDLPIGSLLSALNSSTYAAWVYFTNTGNAWQRIFDFGNAGADGASPNVYMFLTTNNGSRIVRFAIRNAASSAEQAVNGPAALSTGWHHVAVVIDSTAMQLRLYQDGTPVASGATNVLPRDLGVTTQNWLGRSQWTADPFLGGSIDDFRIYNRALSESEVRYLAGDR